MGPVKPAEVLANIRHISCLGLPSEIAIPAMVQALSDLIRSDNSNFSWTDRRGRIVNYYAHSIAPTSLDIMLNHPHLLLGPGELSFEMHSLSSLMTGNIDRFRTVCDLERTVTWNEIWKPNALEQMLDLVVHDQGGSRGLLAFGRAAGQPLFSAEDRRNLLAMRPWILHALDAPADGETVYVENGEEAVLLCDHEGRVVQMGLNAARLVLYAGNGRIAPGAVIAGLGDSFPETVRRICGDLARILSGQPAAPPQARLMTSFGAFVFRGHVLAGQAGSGSRPEGSGAMQGIVAVVIRRELPLPLMLQNSVARLPLTPRQREVAVGIGLGRPAERVQADLGLSAGTFGRHVEDIHERLGVRSRAELMTTLMGHRVATA